MSKKRLALAAAWILLTFQGMAAAGNHAWTFDPPHTTVAFTIQHILAKVAGTFDEVNGSVMFDPSQPEKGFVEVTIPVKSLNTRVEKRDAHLLSEEFFDAEKYPVLTFVSREILRGDTPGRFIARGTLTIKNVSRPLDLPFTFFGTRSHPFDATKEIAGFEAHLMIDRLAFGVGNGEFFRKGLIGKDVDIAVYVEMIREKTGAP